MKPLFRVFFCRLGLATFDGISAAETGGAILAVSDAPDGSYTQAIDGSMTGPNKGRSTSTGKFDENGEEIYKRGSGGYYIVDKNGVQQPTKSPYEHPEANNTGYNRPYLRKQTIEAIEANYTKLPNGDYYNPVTDVTIKGPIDIGHAYGWEHRRLELAAEEVGLTQPQFNEYVNRHPEHFQLENMSINRSHVDEKPGKDEIEDITKEMLKDLNNGDLNR
ncbi:GH-E family nuclease [Psychrobacter lutiphocae]|uniref:GH-E family nuclease n=1 Tax=Psychrobacter lutiphocae TaxID=540500 RepID=UPI0003A25E6A|nr:GH-E family nuclease [Psychrobacter lutiphocae]